MKHFNALMAVVAMACIPTTVRADTFSQPIDLTTFDGFVQEPADLIDHDVYEVSAETGIPSVITPYVSGIVGASFGTLVNGGVNELGAGNFLEQSGNFNRSLFTGGGALGAAIRRPYGQLRAEIEGRARGPISGPAVLRSSIAESVPLHVTASGGWSTLINFWRDVDFNDRVGAYLGGGFGVGGYSLTSFGDVGDGSTVSASNPALQTFAWQVGTGVTYQWSERVVLDVGYRFYEMAPGSYAMTLRDPPAALPFGTFSSAFSASELLFTVRIYEPLRGLIR